MGELGYTGDLADSATVKSRETISCRDIYTQRHSFWLKPELGRHAPLDSGVRDLLRVELSG
jgi:hypothetical protein